jgi:hypothetical protein
VEVAGDEEGKNESQLTRSCWYWAVEGGGGRSRQGRSGFVKKKPTSKLDGFDPKTTAVNFDSCRR